MQAPLFAVHAPDAADSAAKTTTPIDRLRAFGMTLSLKTTPTDSAGAAQDGPSTWDRAAMDLVRDVRLGTAMNRLVVRAPPLPTAGPCTCHPAVSFQYGYRAWTEPCCRRDRLYYMYVLHVRLAAP